MSGNVASKTVDRWEFTRRRQLCDVQLYVLRPALPSVIEPSLTPGSQFRQASARRRSAATQVDGFRSDPPSGLCVRARHHRGVHRGQWHAQPEQPVRIAGRSQARLYLGSCMTNSITTEDDTTARSVPLYRGQVCMDRLAIGWNYYGWMRTAIRDVYLKYTSSNGYIFAQHLLDVKSPMVRTISSIKVSSIQRGGACQYLDARRMSDQFGIAAHISDQVQGNVWHMNFFHLAGRRPLQVAVGAAYPQGVDQQSQRQPRLQRSPIPMPATLRHQRGRRSGRSAQRQIGELRSRTHPSSSSSRSEGQRVDTIDYSSGQKQLLAQVRSAKIKPISHSLQVPRNLLEGASAIPSFAESKRSGCRRPVTSTPSSIRLSCSGQGVR